MTLPVQHFRCVGGTEEGAAGDHSSHGGKQDPGRGHQALEVRRGADGVRSVCAATNDPVSAEWPGPNGAGVSLGSGGAGPGRGRVGARAWRRGRSGLQLLDPLPAAAFSPGSREPGPGLGDRTGVEVGLVERVREELGPGGAGTQKGPPEAHGQDGQRPRDRLGRPSSARALM